jgi:thiamine transport system permease protein
LPAPLEWAAATLGASPWRVFRSVTWPLLRDTVLGAAAVVFVFSFTSFGVIRLLGTASTRTVEVEIWRQATQLGRLDVAATLTVVQVLVLGLVLGLSAWRHRSAAAAVGRPDVERRRAHGTARLWVAAVVGGTVAVVGAPLLAMALRSLHGPRGWSFEAWRTLDRVEVRPGIRLGVDPLAALGRSLTTAGWATLVAVLVGGLTVLAIDAARRGGRLLDAGALLPLGTSAVTLGLGMLITFDAPPVDWRAEWWLVPVGHALIAVPFVVRSSLGVLRGIPADLHQAAATLGATPTRAWFDVTVRRLRRPLVQGAALAAAVSLGEFGATSFLSRTGGETAPLAIERLLSRTGDLVRAQGFALATILAVLTVLVVALAGIDDLDPRAARPAHRRRARRRDEEASCST